MTRKDKNTRPLANSTMSAYDQRGAVSAPRGGPVPKIKGFLNVPQAAEKLGVGDTRVHALIKSGQLVPDLVDGCFAYFKSRTLTRFQKTRREGPGMPAGARTAKTKDYPTCPECSGPSRKWTAYAGKPRWRCVNCKKVFYAGGDENLPMVEKEGA